MYGVVPLLGLMGVGSTLGAEWLTVHDVVEAPCCKRSSFSVGELIVSNCVAVLHNCSHSIRLHYQYIPVKTTVIMVT